MSGPLKKYWFTRGDGVKTVLKLNDADAARHGLGPDDLFRKDSSAEPVAEGGDGDGAADDSGDVQAVAAADAGGGVGPVQSAADSGGDGQAPGDPAAVSASGDSQEAAVSESNDSPAAELAEADGAGAKVPVKAPAKKAAAKRTTTSANKARTSAANKAESPGG
ncbi:hypothetical protein QBB34_34115 [Streptomyces stelliscabiei]|uniref:hypothetical protein n=1 Tax=Streptomyces stelliscabiei TaxID=146820 RepID=UPI002FF06D73